MNRFEQMTATPEALAVWLEKIWSSRDHFCFDEQFCKSNCDNIDDCRHELECIAKWLNEQAEEKEHE